MTVIPLVEHQTALCVQTRGVDAPERLYAPFKLATTAAAMGMDATTFFLIKGSAVLKRDEAEIIPVESFPTLQEVTDQTATTKMNLEVWEQSCLLLGLEQDAFATGALVVGATSLNDRLLDADTVLSF